MKIRYLFYSAAGLLALAAKILSNVGQTSGAFITLAISFAILGGSYLLARYCDRRFGYEN